MFLFQVRTILWEQNHTSLDNWNRDTEFKGSFRLIEITNSLGPNYFFITINHSFYTFNCNPYDSLITYPNTHHTRHRCYRQVVSARKVTSTAPTMPCACPTTRSATASTTVWITKMRSAAVSFFFQIVPP